MATDLIEMGKISARGQIAIPSQIREKMGLKEGEKVLFLLSEDTLILKKVSFDSFAEITKPLKERALKQGLKENDVSDLVHNFRKRK